MKTLTVLILAGFLCVVLAHDAEQKKLDTLIHAHKVKLAMTQDQVKQSLGEPVTKFRERDLPAAETWVYPTQLITFGHGKMINSHPIKAPGEGSPGRSLSYNPAVGWVEHDSNVSRQQVIGR